MSKPREFWLSDLHVKTILKDDVSQETRLAFSKIDGAIVGGNHIEVIELTPEVSRKLELFDEAVEVIKFLIKTLTILYPLFETMGEKGLSVKEDLQNREKQARQFLKKLGE